MADSPDIEKRLDRIEGKLDELSKAMIDLVRFDQKLTSCMAIVSDLQQRVSTAEEKVNKIEIRCATREGAVDKVNELYARKDSLIVADETARLNIQWLDKIIWAAVGGVLVLLGNKLLGILFK